MGRNSQRTHQIPIIKVIQQVIFRTAAAKPQIFGVGETLSSLTFNQVEHTITTAH